jgi:ankyrin repeat protein
MRLLLDHGADVNTTIEGRLSPLCSACDGNHLEVMRLLLGRGADANMTCSATHSTHMLHHVAVKAKIVISTTTTTQRLP